MNTLETIETRLAKKTAGLTSDSRKIENLNAQITQYSNSIERIEAGLPQKQGEVDLLTSYFEEAKELTRKSDTLGSEMERIRAFYDQFTWAIDMPYEEKLESSVDYNAKLRERQTVEARLTEIEKLANKTYYRR